MATDRAVVWVDYSQARIMTFGTLAADVEAWHIAVCSGDKNVAHHSGGPGRLQEAEFQNFFQQAADAVRDAREILIVGPCSAKLFFMQYLLKSDPEGAKKVVGVEAVDHPTEAQLLAFGRRYFDAMQRARNDAASAVEARPENWY